MRTAVIFLLCLTATAVMGSEVTKALRKIESSKYGKTLLSTIELELSSGSKDPRGQITNLLDELAGEIQDDQSNHDSIIAGKRTQFADDYDRLTNRISDLQNTITAASQDADAQATLRDSTQSVVDIKNGQIADIQVAQQNDDNLRADEHAAFESFQDKYQDLVDALHEVRGWISDRQDEVQGNSFLQVRSASFLQATSKMDATAKRHPVVAPIFAMIKNRLKGYFDDDGNFVAAGGQGVDYNTINVDPTGAATQGFGGILDLIDALTETFVGYLGASVDAENDAQNTYDANTAQRNLDIAGLQADVSAGEATIAGAIAQIAVDNAIVVQASAELQAAQDELQNDIDQQNAAEQYYADKTEERNEELGIIGQIRDILSNSLSHLTDYMENKIGETDDDGLINATA